MGPLIASSYLIKGVSSLLWQKMKLNKSLFLSSDAVKLRGGKLQVMIMSAVNIVSLYRTINKIMKLVSKRSR